MEFLFCGDDGIGRVVVAVAKVGIFGVGRVKFRG
jgi:nitrogen regulatory protein PII-like uncharacterized protein